MSTQENLIKVFEYALNQERTGMAFFESSLGRLSVGAAVSAFKTLIAQEEKHIEFITRILRNIRESGGVDESQIKAAVLAPSDFFDDRAKSEFLEQCVIGSMVPDVTVFNTAWLIEKDLAEFYGSAARQTEGRVSESLGMLAEWEKAHERFFRDFRDQLTETYANMPWGG